MGDAFGAAERLEFQDHDFGGAIALLRGLSQHDDPAIRAGALLRLARNLRKGGQADRALAVYDELTRLESLSVDGLPAELAARHARCTMFEQLARPDDLRREAQALDAALSSRRWLVPRAAYRFYRAEARKWIGAGTARDEERDTRGVALAEAAESLWNEWQAIRTTPGGAGRRTLTAQGRPVLALWRTGADRSVALIAGPTTVEGQWIRTIRPLLDREGVHLGARIVAPTMDLVHDLVHNGGVKRSPKTVNVHEAKTHFSRLLQRVERGDEVVIARAGKPIARLLPFEAKGERPIFGIDEGRFTIPDDFDDPLPDEVLKDFYGE